jgi:hypothetical protein
MQLAFSYVRILLFLLCSGVSVAASAQTPLTLWSKGYGGSGSDLLHTFTRSHSGGYVMVGTTTSVNGDVVGKTTGTTDNDWWIAEVNDTGAIVRQVVKGSTGSDYLYSIRAVASGGYIAAGFVTSADRDFTGINTHGGLDAAIVRLDDTLGIKWVKAMGGSGAETFYDIQVTPSNGFVACGYTASNNGDITNKLNGTSDDWWVVVTDSAGNIVHNKTFGGSGSTSLLYLERPSSIINSLEGGYVVTGGSASNDGDLTGKGLGKNDYWVLKLSDTLGIQWSRTYGGTNNDAATAVIQNADSTYMVCGQTNSVDGTVQNPKGGGNYDVMLLKIKHQNGDTLWTRNYGGTGSDQASGYNSITPTLDGGWVIASTSSSSNMDVSGHIGGTTNTSSDAWVLKVDTGGHIDWEKSLGTVGLDYSQQIIQHEDGTYFFLGRSNGTGGDVGTNKGSSDVFMVKLSACPAYTYLADTICQGGSFAFGSRLLTQQGTYWDTLAMTSTGCDSLVQLKLVVNSVAVPVITAAGNTLSTGTYAAYQWLDANNQPIANATAASFNPAASGAYRVVVTGSNGCSDTSAVYSFIALGMTETATGWTFGLYPNPVMESFTVSIPATQLPAVLRVTDVNGRMLTEQHLTATVTIVSATDLPAGVYILQVRSASGAITQKLVKQ